MELTKLPMSTFWDELAIESYKTILKAKPTNALVHNNLGLAYLRKDMLRKALRCFQLAIKCDPEFADAYYHIGTTYHRLGDLKAAVRFYEQYHKLKADDKHASEMLADLVGQLKAGI